MNEVERGQIDTSAAEVYEEFFLPALFQEWAGPVADAARIAVGQRVLDVACGTGVLAREVANRVGPAGSVVGLDVNEGMLALARRKSPAIEWRRGPAEAMPFDDQQFDAVVSQFGLMFFEDQRAAIEEMARVLRPGGRLAVAVWDSLDNTAGYAAMTALLERLFGAEVADALRAPFTLGDVDELHALLADTGLTGVEVRTRTGTARFPSIQAWVYTDVKGWTLAGMLDEAQFEQLQSEAETELQAFVTAQGAVAFRSPAHIITAARG
jgi:SAM-dependent methyltransferase